MHRLDPKFIRNFDKKKSPIYNDITSIVDIRNEDDLSFDNDIDTVILLAAEHRDDVNPISLYYDVNVRGTLNVLNAMDRASISNIIFTSSVAVYGLNKDNPSESSLTDPFNHYGKSKFEAEKIIESWFNKDPLKRSVTIIKYQTNCDFW